jgi:hypothetical protein
MNSFKTKYMPKRLNMRVQYVMRINFAILAKHLPGILWKFEFVEWRQELLKRCNISVGETTVTAFHKALKVKQLHSRIKNSAETKKSRLVRVSKKRKMSGGMSPDKYKGKGDTKPATIKQLKELAKEKRISLKGLKKKADIARRVQEGLDTECWVEIAPLEIPTFSNFSEDVTGEFF